MAEIESTVLAAQCLDRSLPCLSSKMGRGCRKHRVAQIVASGMAPRTAGPTARLRITTLLPACVAPLTVLHYFSTR